MILAQLALTNIMLLLCRGIPLVILHWKNKYFLDEVGCKIVFYIQRIGRSMSVCSTCLLSGCQAIIINSHSATWANFKRNTPKYSTIYSVSCWLLNIVTHVTVITNITGPMNQINITNGIDLRYCYWREDLGYSIILSTVEDVFFVNLMIFCCAYMLHFLHRHHRHIQYIHKTNISPRITPEMKITRRIVLLMITFFSFYSINGILTLYSKYFLHANIWLLEITAFMAFCFPTIGPFLLITSSNPIFR
ncbi:PREDICTED: vomeronasal type-1 receptor 4-like [Elephantulus edwardii]|uniref:vomeronasal type-1 receptor 4-like n=1 Tax=Elephantulus edwardii TaxID=28737 RepID=UPI0003F05883|nr:PREDICTED: vomeronasal type-1 receptor 4-like [Elephantulus edwardii]